MSLCEHLEPKEEDLKNNGERPWKRREVPYHICRLKQAMGMRNRDCAFSTYINTFVLQYVRYDSVSSRKCPMFTSDPILAEKMYDAAKGLRKYIAAEHGAVVGSQ